MNKTRSNLRERWIQAMSKVPYSLIGLNGYTEQVRICNGCVSDRSIKLPFESFPFTICTNPQMGYKDTGREILALSTSLNFTECEFKQGKLPEEVKE